jgi:hypothetical protein
MTYFDKLTRLTGGTLAPGDFNHLDHVGVAYEALCRHDFFHAAAHVASGLRGLAGRAGAPQKFNATITWAFMSLIAERMVMADYRDAKDFIERNPGLGRSTALAPWYSKERLNSAPARSIALLPDLLVGEGRS